MFPLQEKFDPNGPVSQIPLDWFETVAKILNHLAAGGTVVLTKTPNPGKDSPWRIDGYTANQSPPRA